MRRAFWVSSRDVEGRSEPRSGGVGEAFPHAAIYELTAEGIERADFDDLPAVSLWRRFLADPPSYYRRLLDD